jgi:NAD(P)-dependent dehydrogenase (short-subunit alcohol dehydrogenase family)
MILAFDAVLCGAEGLVEHGAEALHDKLWEPQIPVMVVTGRSDTVAPGYVEIDMTAKFFSDQSKRRSAVERSPFRRLGNAVSVLTGGTADYRVYQCERWVCGIEAHHREAR